MNNFERQSEIDEMVAAHTPRELAAMVLDARGAAPSVKAEAVRDWADQANPNNESEDRMVSSAYDYANEL